MATGKVTFMLNIVDKNVDQKLNNFSNKLDKVIAKTEGLNNKKLSKLASEETKININIKNVEKNVTKTKKEFTKLDAVKLSAINRGTNELISVLKTSTQSAVNFTFQMDKMKAVTEGTDTEMSYLQNRILTLSKETTKTTSEIAETAIEMGKLGLSSVETADSLNAVVKSAEATGEPLNNTGYLISVIAKQFKLSVKEMDSIADKVVIAANKSALGVDDMITVFKYVGPSASALGVDLDELISVMMTLRDAGLGASQMGTSLRFVLTNLANPTTKVQGALDELGIEAFDAQGKFKGLTVFIKELQKATADLTDQEKLRLQSDVAGKRALSAISILTDETTGKVEKYTQVLKDSEGAADEASATMRENLVAQLNSLAGSIETVIVQIVDFFEPALLAIVKSVKAVVNNFGFLVGIINTVIDGIVNFGNNVGEAIFGTDNWNIILLSLKETLGIISGIMSVVTTAMLIYIGVMKVYTFVTATASTITTIFSVALKLMRSALFKTMGIIGLILVPLLLFFNLFKNNEGFHNAVMNGINAVKNVLEQIWPTIQKVGQIIMELLVTAFQFLADIITNYIVPALQQMYDFFVANILPVLQQLYDFFVANIIPVLQQLYDFFVANILPILQSLWEILVILVGIFMELFVTIIQGFVIPVVQALWEIFVALIPIFQAVWEILLALGEVVLVVAQAFWEIAVTVLQDLVLPILELLFDFFKAYIIPILEKLAEFIVNVVVPAFVDIVNFILEHVIPILKNLATFISEKVVPIIQKLADFFAKVLKKALDIINKVLQDVIIPILKALADFVSDHVVPGIKRLADMFQKTLKKALDIVKGPIDLVKGALDKVLDVISSVIDWIQKLADKISDVGEKIGGFFDKLNPFKSGKSFDLGISEQRAIAFSYGSGFGNLQGRGLTSYQNTSNIVDNRATHVYVNSVEEAKELIGSNNDAWKKQQQNRRV